MPNFSLLGCLEVVDLLLEIKKQQQQKIHRMNGFLSLQLELRMELGLRLRRNNILVIKESSIILLEQAIHLFKILISLKILRYVVQLSQ